MYKRLFLAQIFHYIGGSFGGLFITVVIFNRLLAAGYQQQTALAFAVAIISFQFVFNLIGAIWSGKILAKYNVGITLLTGATTLATSYLLYGFAGDNIAVILASSALFGLGLITWWHGFNIGSSLLTAEHEVGKWYTRSVAAGIIVSLIGPVAYGALLANLSEQAGFILAAAATFIAGIAGRSITVEKPMKQPTVKKIINTIKNAGDDSYAFLGDGFGTAMAVAVWPLFIFLYSGNDYFLSGLVVSLISGVAAIANYTLSHIVDQKGEKIFVSSTIVVAALWFTKILGGPIALIAHVFHDATDGIQHASYASGVLKKARVDADTNNYHVARESILNFGRVVGSFITVVLLLIGTPLTYTFAVAGIGTLIMLKFKY